MFVPLWLWDTHERFVITTNFPGTKISWLDIRFFMMMLCSCQSYLLLDFLAVQLRLSLLLNGSVTSPVFSQTTPTSDYFYKPTAHLRNRLRNTLETLRMQPNPTSRLQPDPFSLTRNRLSPSSATTSSSCSPPPAVGLPPDSTSPSLSSSSYLCVGLELQREVREDGEVN